MMASPVEAEKCPDTLVVLTVYQYSAETDAFTPDGKTTPIKSTSFLHTNVSDYVHTSNNGDIKLNFAEMGGTIGVQTIFR